MYRLIKMGDFSFINLILIKQKIFQILFITFETLEKIFFYSKPKIGF